MAKVQTHMEENAGVIRGNPVLNTGTWYHQANPTLGPNQDRVPYDTREISALRYLLQDILNRQHLCYTRLVSANSRTSDSKTQLDWLYMQPGAAGRGCSSHKFKSKTVENVKCGY